MIIPTYSLFTVEMQPIYYRNYYSKLYYTDPNFYSNYGHCCDPYYAHTYYCEYNQCDNYFELCVRTYGSTSFGSDSSSCTYGRKVTPVAGDDAFSFPSSYIGTSSSSRIDNPIIFTYTGTTPAVRDANYTPLATMLLEKGY